MIESIVIALLFSLALAYLGNLVRKQFSARNTAGCAKGCGACGTIDFKKIEQQMAAKEKKQLEEVQL
jgi:hypothetical protein